MRTALYLLPWLSGGMACAVWAWRADQLHASHGLALLLWLLVCGLVFHDLRRPVTGMLRWDGQHWNWESGGRNALGIVAPRLDWQQGLLLEFRSPDGRGHWLWPERHADSLRWGALRRALYAPVADSADPDGRLTGDAERP